MDFKKIARIFIIAFTLLNIYLLIGILERQDIQDISIQTNSSSDVLENMEQLNIEVPDLSSVDVENAEVYSIQINSHNLLEETVEENSQFTGTLSEDGTTYYVSFHSNPFELEGNPEDGFTDNDIASIQTFINSDQVMFGEEYGFGHYDRAGRQFVFHQIIDGLPIMDGTSEISLFVNDAGEIYAYEQTYAGPGSRQGTPLQLISANRALEILFMNNEIRSGSEIEVPTLSYRRGLYLEDLSMYSPVWLVEVIHSSERNIFRVDAVNGTIIRQPVTVPGENNGTDSGTDPEDTEDDTDSETEADNEETDLN
jgi:regulatory protein YycI of two-component signal transduction system YycFG